MDLLESKWLNWLLIAGACILFGLVAPANPRLEMLDQHVYSQTVEKMDNGSGYYAAMDDALREVYGPSSTPRAFRLPTIFVLWATLGLGDRGIWFLFLGVAFVTGITFTALSKVPLVGLLLTLYLLLTGMLPGDGWMSQYTTTELWAIPLVAATILAWQRGHYRWAAAGALAAFSIREITAVLIVSGMVAAWRRRLELWPWVSASVVAACGYLAHVWAVHPYLTDEGAETALIGTGSPAAVGRIAGFGLPGGPIAGFVLLGIAVVYLRKSEDKIFLAGLAALPLAGLLADRPYWGVLVAPILVIWAADVAADVFQNSLAPRLARHR